MPAKRLSLTGFTFGRLKVISDAPPYKWQSYSLCKCECGNEKIICNNSLNTGKTKSCGCIKRSHPHALRHGHRRGQKSSKTYSVWQGMRGRCSDSKNVGFVNYGGRGIKVCERWQHFEHFLEDMGEPPKGCWIERKNNNGNYEPNNCVWATPKQQNRNRRDNHIVTVCGKTGPLSAIAEEFGVKCGLVFGRIAKGWNIEAAFFTPPYFIRTHPRKQSICRKCGIQFTVELDCEGAYCSKQCHRRRGKTGKRHKSIN